MCVTILEETASDSSQLSLCLRLQLLFPLDSRSLCLFFILHLFPFGSEGRVVEVQPRGSASVCAFHLAFQDSCGDHHIQRIIDPPPNVFLLFELALNHIKSTRSPSQGSNLSISAATSW